MSISRFMITYSFYIYQKKTSRIKALKKENNTGIHFRDEQWIKVSLWTWKIWRLFPLGIPIYHGKGRRIYNITVISLSHTMRADLRRSCGIFSDGNPALIRRQQILDRIPNRSDYHRKSSSAKKVFITRIRNFWW